MPLPKETIRRSVICRAILREALIRFKPMMHVRLPGGRRRMGFRSRDGVIGHPASIAGENRTPLAAPNRVMFTHAVRSRLDPIHASGIRKANAKDIRAAKRNPEASMGLYRDRTPREQLNFVKTHYPRGGEVRRSAAKARKENRARATGASSVHDIGGTYHDDGGFEHPNPKKIRSQESVVARGKLREALDRTPVKNLGLLGTGIRHMAGDEKHARKILARNIRADRNNLMHPSVVKNRALGERNKLSAILGSVEKNRESSGCYGKLREAKIKFVGRGLMDTAHLRGVAGVTPRKVPSLPAHEYDYGIHLDPRSSAAQRNIEAVHGLPGEFRQNLRRMNRQKSRMNARFRRRPYQGADTTSGEFFAPRAKESLSRRGKLREGFVSSVKQKLFGMHARNIDKALRAENLAANVVQGFSVPVIKPRKRLLKKPSRVSSEMRPNQ